MIRKIDKLWFRLLEVIHRWTIRQAESHGRHEKERRFRLLMGLRTGTIGKTSHGWAQSGALIQINGK